MSQRIVIVEGDPGYTAKLESLISEQEGYSVAARFDSAIPLLAAASAMAGGNDLSWDLILLNLTLPGMSGVEAANRLKELLPQVPIIIYTVFETPAAIVRAIRPGSDGQRLMRTSTRELLEHLQAVTVSVPAREGPGIPQRRQVSGLRPTTLDPYARAVRRGRP
jgi:two-component system, NarL family, response regulator DesR